MCSMFLPRSSISTRSPRSVNSFAAQPPEMPEPTTMASKTSDWSCIMLLALSAEAEASALRDMPSLRTNRDVAEPYRVAVILQRDTTTLRASVRRHLHKLAGLHERLPCRAPQLVLDDLDPVHPVLDVRPCHDEPRIVPFADRPRDIAYRRLQSVIGAGRCQRVLAIRVTGVVED